MNPAYIRYMQSPEWRAKAARRRRWDGNQCWVCGSRRNLQVHHRTYKRFGHEWWLFDLVTLCERCHKIETAYVRALRWIKRRLWR